MPMRATDADLERVVALQRAAYARNRTILGVEPLPLMADYVEIFRTMEVWLDQRDERLAGVLILELQASHLLIWSIATDPDVQAHGVGKELLGFAEARARQLGLSTMRLYTGTLLAHLVAWYGRNGYATERIEELPDRSVTHMVKRLAA